MSSLLCIHLLVTQYISCHYAFTCDDGDIIYDTEVCDGFKDCSDGLDEDASICANQDCAGINQWKCDDGGCIKLQNLCDNTTHCDDSSDEWESLCNNKGCSMEYQFRCTNGECIPKSTAKDISVICDGFSECNDGSDELECGYTWNCHALDIHTMAYVKSEYYGLNLTNATLSNIRTTIDDISSIGIDISDSYIQIALLYINTITAIFIIIGLIKYQSLKQINLNYIILLIIALQHLLMTSVNFFAEPLTFCSVRNGTLEWQTLSPFDVCQYISSAVLWYLWVSSACYGECCLCTKRCFKMGSIVVIVLMVSLTAIALVIENPLAEMFLFHVQSNSRYYDQTQLLSRFLYFVFHRLIPTIWCLSVCKCKFCQSSLARILLCICWLCISFVLFDTIHICEWFGIDESLCNSMDGSAQCFTSVWPLWFDPIMIIMSLYLLFTEAKYLVLVQHIMIAISLIIGIMNSNMCYYIINVTYIAHSLLVPIYTILIFVSVKKVRVLAYDIISIYVVSFDVFTDIIIVFYFINTKDYILAVLQTIFIFMGQTFGSITGQWFNEAYETLSKKDKLITFLGFGRVWFLIHSWCEYDVSIQENTHKYTTLSHKHHIWEIMYENMPSVALQIYVILRNRSFSLTIISSILISTLKIGYDTLRYLIKVRQSTENENATIEQSGAGRIRIGCLQIFNGNKSLFTYLFIFMATDFYLRSIPLIILMALITCEPCKYITFVFLFGILAIFEFVMNKKMRFKQYRSNIIVVQIFMTSIFSSFYNILSCLDLLKDDKMFGKTVNFELLLREHKFRIYFSIVFTVVNVSLLVILNNNSKNVLILILVVLYAIVLGVNIFAVKCAKRRIYNVEATVSADIYINEESQHSSDNDVEEIQMQTVNEYRKWNAEQRQSLSIESFKEEDT